MRASASRSDRPLSMTCVTPRDRGLGERLGRSRKSGGSSGKEAASVAGGAMLTAGQGRTEGGERGRQLALEAHRDVRQRPVLPLRAQEPEDVDVVVAAAVAGPDAPES